MAIIRPSLTFSAAETRFISLSGVLQKFAQTTKNITRPGVDGEAFRKEGRRAAPSQFKAMADSSTAAAEALKQAVADMKSQIGTYKDEFGASTAGVFVVDVELVEDRAIGSSTGGLANPSQRLITWHITLQRTTLPP